MALSIFPSGYSDSLDAGIAQVSSPGSFPIQTPGILLPFATVPVTPAAPTATVENTQSTVSWTAPADGGTALMSYWLQVYLSGSPSGSPVSVGLVTSYLVTGLTNGSSYTFTVLAENVVGASAYSAASTAVVPATTPGTPAQPTAVAGAASATVTWATPSTDGYSAITGYDIQPYIAGSVSGSPTSVGVVLSTSVSGLTNGTAYTFAVRAKNAIGNGSYSSASSAVTPVTTPATPNAPVATSGDTLAALTWSAPANGGSAITGYNVVGSPGGSASFGAVTSGNVTGLTNGTSYTFTVRASNAQGAGSYSSASNAIVPSVHFAQPIVVINAGNVVVSYDAINWTTTATLPTVSGSRNSIAYGGGVYVVPTGNTSSLGRVDYCSGDPGVSTNWTRSTFNPGINIDWGNVFYGNGVFVIPVLNSNRIYSSSDGGVTWVLSTPTDTTGTARKTGTYGNGIYVAAPYGVSSASLLSSTTGTSGWTARVAGATRFWSMAWGNPAAGNKFIALAGAGDASITQLNSTDGTTWITHNMPSANWNAVTYGVGSSAGGQGRFVAIGPGSKSAYSTNGTAWTAVTMPSNTGSALTFTNGMFVAVGSGLINISTNGTSWTAVASPPSGAMASVA